ncbi:MAG: phenylalanine--tRNA ligase subunit alpha [candidate division Zixibacteria bacterium]|nr:phenylalanine--tRNA ligase subunit alpha [candidate division Zixibacteria bacterium]
MALLSEGEIGQLVLAAEKEIESASTPEELSTLKIKYVGRSGILTLALRGLKDISPEDRPKVGQALNSAKVSLEEKIDARTSELEAAARKTARGFFDHTLPGTPYFLGHPHPLVQVNREIVRIFNFMGFETATGPEIETDYYNFEALNFPKDHPARDMWDTFYLQDSELLLRTHTSPVQARVFEKRKPPIKILAPGRVYRHEAINARSYYTFLQIEGFYVDADVSFADLKGVLHAFVSAFYGDVKTRFRPSFFPFTEPSAEMDISCTICGGKGCSVCKYEGWLEILGCGMIHPQVFRNVGYDPEVWRGYAFGLGVDRIAMQKYRIDDIRLFYENDLRFLEQF